MTGLPASKLPGFIAGTYSTPSADEALDSVTSGLGLGSAQGRVLRALAACGMGFPPEEVSRLISWQEFEQFCGGLLRACGFSVKRNIVLTKPRVQLDLVATGVSACLAVDCKHWARSGGPAVLTSAALAQLRRAEVLRTKQPRLPPIGAVILTLGYSRHRFIEGVAVVPVYSIRDFVAGIGSYDELRML